MFSALPPPLITPRPCFSFSVPGPLSINPGDALGGLGLGLDNPAALHEASRLLVAQFDQFGLGFPIRALIVGPKVLGELSLGGREARYEEMREEGGGGGEMHAHAQSTLRI